MSICGPTALFEAARSEATSSQSGATPRPGKLILIGQ
jgi:hypothetical protein